MAPGTLVRPPDLKIAAPPRNGTTRVFADGEHGYALAFIGLGTYPARTMNAGKTWRIAGPVLHVHAAQGGLGVGEIGVAGPSTAFAWGGVTPDSVIDVTTDGGKEWWRAFMPGLVLFVGHEGGTVVANVYATVTHGHAKTAAVWVYATKAGRRWTYITSLGVG